MFDFPASPALNDQFVAGNITYTWNGYAWVPSPQTGVLTFMVWPAGIGVDWWGSTLPQGTRWCDGAQYNPSNLPALYAAIGATFNTGGETSGWFRVPDAKGRSTIGKDDMGGTAAGRVTTAGGHGIDGEVLGAKGGAETHTLTAAQIAAHTHGYTVLGTAAYGSAGFSINAGNYDQARTTTSAGGNGTHPNVQPGIVCNKLITTGGVA